MSVHIQYGYVCSMYRRSVLTADLLTGSNNNTHSARAETLWRFLFVFIYNLYTFIYYYEAYGSFTLDAIGKTGYQIASSRVQHHQALGSHLSTHS